MADQTILQFSELGIHSIDQGVDGGIHFSGGRFGLYPFPVRGADGFRLMLKLLNPQHHLNRSNLEPVPIEPSKPRLEVQLKGRRDLHAAPRDLEFHEVPRLRP